MRILELSATEDDERTYLLDWSETFAPACSSTFHHRARTFSYRISRYLDAIIDAYLPLGFPSSFENDAHIDDLYRSQKHSVALTIAGAFRLLADGLFLQSGVLLRTSIESSMVLLDVAQNPLEVYKLLENKYQSQSVLKRVKRFVPTNLITWYGYFSANFAHVASLHQAQYLPRACYPDNWVIVTGLQNLLRGVVSYHIMLERAYARTHGPKWFWRASGSEFEFDDQSTVFKWAEDLGKSITEQIPPNERPPEGLASKWSVSLKTR